MPSPVAPGGFVVRSQSEAAACGDQRRPRLDRAPLGQDTGTAPFRRRDRSHRLAFCDANARVLEHPVDQHAEDLLAGGGTGDVEHATA